MNETFVHNGGTFGITRTGDAAAPVRLLLLHGWKQPASSLNRLVATLQKECAIIGLDTPGNTIAPEPPATWDITDYVDGVREFMATQPMAPTIIVCHSFGARLAMRLAAQNLPWLHGIAVVGGHGLRPIRPWYVSLKLWSIVRVTKIAGFADRLLGLGLKAKWAGRFGATDYKNAGAMRDVFVRVIRDDVAPLLPQVTVPVLLVYGGKDVSTPVVMGQKYHDLLAKSELIVMPNDDHYTLLDSAVVATHVKNFVKKVLV